MAATLIATLALAPAAVQAQDKVSLANPVHTAMVQVTLGKSQDIRTDQSFADVVIGDASVADVNPLTDRSLSILGKKIGTTRVTVYGTDKKPVGIFDIQVSFDVTQLSSEIERVSGSGIKVASINGRIYLSGTAPDAVTLDKAVMIARQFAPDPINTVKVLQQQQVLMEVRFIEVDRSASRELGVQWNAFGSKATVNIGDQAAATGASTGVTLPVTATTAAGVLSGTAPFGFAVGQLLGNSQNSLSLAINALEQKGLARSLAEPNLVALSGDNASFLAGGSIPIPQASATGTPSFAYQDYGVSLNFTPTVLNDGVINLHISPQVSEIDTSVSVTIAGATVPGLTKRSASTTLELRDGQSFMLGGLLQNTSSTAQSQLPWVGNLPVLGALFRSSQYQKQETDLVIVVTPHIVHPLRPSDVVRTPFDNSLPGNDVDFFLMGNAEVSPQLARLAVGSLNRPYVGHVLDLPKNGGAYVSVKD
ncbi:MAG: type II and III secretion system protein family protein [Xanthobacteraceae bacterium]